jgi:hypothetical protein
LGGGWEEVFDVALRQTSKTTNQSISTGIDSHDFEIVPLGSKSNVIDLTAFTHEIFLLDSLDRVKVHPADERYHRSSGERVPVQERIPGSSKRCRCFLWWQVA